MDPKCKPMLNYRNHNLLRAFADFLFDNDENVASRLKIICTNIKARVQKLYPIYDQNGQNQLKPIPYLWPKQLKTHTLWAAHTYMAHIREYPPPLGWARPFNWYYMWQVSCRLLGLAPSLLLSLSQWLQQCWS